MAEEKQVKDQKIKLTSSLKGKISLITDLALLVLMVTLLVALVPQAQNALNDLMHNYMYETATAYGSSLENEVNLVGLEEGLSAEFLTESLGDVEMEGISSSYAYVVSPDGTMLYHPTADKIGSSVENSVVLGLVSQLQAGTVPANDVVEYEFKGATKYAAYYIPRSGDFILVMSADKDEVMEPVQRMLTVGIVAGLIIVLVMALIMLLIVNKMLAPIERMRRFVDKLADLDFSAGKNSKELTDRKDEIGAMSRSIISLQEKLVAVIDLIKQNSTRLYESSDGMFRNATNMSETSSQVDHAVNEIAEGATSQANETQKATENVLTIGNMIEETSEEVRNLNEMAEAMKRANQEAVSILQELGQVNRESRTSIEEIAEQTATTNASASKIREVTSMIAEIAEETNLLSLNASIEAARAGDAGRGFAVVASQIQKLADQSNSSAKQIEQIIDQLISDSQKSVETMEEVKNIIAQQSEDVDKTEAAFGEVSTGIDQSLDVIQLISDKVATMDEARIHVVDTVQSLTAIAEENAASTQESSASVTTISGIALDIEQNSGDLKDIAQALEDNMNQFKY